MLENTSTTEKRSLYITYSRAKNEYGLTDKMFKLLGPPDKKAPNPHYKKAAPMRLYLIERLEGWIRKNLEWVEKARARREKLSAAQKLVHEKKRQKMIALANSWEPKIANSLPKKVIREARQYYTYWYHDFDELTQNGLISYIRHQYTDYEKYLARLPKYKGQTGKDYLYLILREKVDGLILIKFVNLLHTLK